MKFYHWFMSGVFYIVSKLSFPVMYFLSDILAFKLNHLIRYRRSVVTTNLRRAFPNADNNRLKRIRNRYYRNLTDLFFEVIKTQNIQKEELARRITFNNNELLEDLHLKGKSVIVTIGHCGNWEWMTQVLDMKGPFRTFAVVKPLNDPYFEEYMKRLRTKFTVEGRLIPFKSTLREMVRYRDEQTITIFAGDQTPVKEEINYWTTFLNQDTPVFLGIEKIAKALDFPVLFFDIQREKRGYYQVGISMIEEHPAASTDFEITEKHVRKLESVIQDHPDNWLWSHRRWKHSKG
jgi:Kdo2-lipid IVA lauroyltransferase/acyltransferase